MISIKHLPNKIKDEKIEIFIKRHWFIFLIKILFYFILFIIPFLFYFLIGEELYGTYDNNVRYSLIILIANVYYLSVWLFFSANITNNFLDYWIVTNKRIISINQNGFFSRAVNELPLSRVQDITCETSGFFPTILHYGNIQIQSAGAKQLSVFKQVPRSAKIAQDILRLVEKNKFEI